MKVRTKLIGRIVLLAFSALIMLYLIIGYYYSKGFPCCTWVNGVYCTGKSVATVNSELCKKFKYDGIEIKDATGVTLFISAEDIDFEVDYTDALNEFISSQNALSWGIYIFKGLTGSVEPVFSSDKEKLASKLSDWEIFVPKENLEVAILKTDKGYELKNDLISVPNQEKILEAVSHATLNAAEEIDLSSEDFKDCYEAVTPTPEQQEIIDLYAKIQPVINCGITYELGTRKIALKDGTGTSFLLTYEEFRSSSDEEYEYDNPGKGRYLAGVSEVNISTGAVRNLEGFVVTQNGDPLISESRMYDFFYKLAKDSDTATALERYKNGEDVEILVSKSRTGNPRIFDYTNEYEHLKKVFSSGSDKVTEEVRQLSDPDKVDCFNAKNDLGGTYVEVDISRQHLYYYTNGEIAMETDIVTGDMHKGHGTPSGFFHIYDKQKEKILHGDDYDTLVHFWMRLNNNGIGIHDAYWKHEFGGDIYMYNGSHGCVNCPPDIAEWLWNNVKSKTPVIVYYR